jgi:DNA-binding transcriptional LysR family regulator
MQPNDLLAPFVQLLQCLKSCVFFVHLPNMGAFNRNSRLHWAESIDLDGRLLQLLMTVVETGSVTAAAARLGVTQSAVSHLLDKLRGITGDQLFVKSGRGIVATRRAEQLALQARELLSALHGFAQSERFDPAQWKAAITIAANDLQRDLLLPALMTRLRQSAPGLSLHVIPSDVPSLEMLRNEHCQLVISPRPPDGTDILQKRLFEDPYRVFFDPRMRQAPATRAQYLAARHVTVLYHPRRALDLDQWLLGKGVERQFEVTVPGYAGVAPFVSGTTLLATAPSLLARHMLRDLASAKVPIACPKMPMYMVWHMRHQHSHAHQWLRQQLQSVTQAVLAPS